MRKIKQIDLIRGYTDAQKMAEFLYDIAQEQKSVEEIKAHLEEDIPEDTPGSPWSLEAVARSDYPWSFPEAIRNPSKDCNNGNR